MPLRRSAEQREGHPRQVQRTEPSGARTAFRPHCALEEAARSGAAEPADRPHPAAKPACPPPLPPRAGAGTVSRRRTRQSGRILQQTQRAAARFAIALEPDGCPAGLRLVVSCNASFDDWAALSEGAYLLRSNIADWSDQQLWKAYIQLTQAEAAFRIQKDQLNLRPIWHQREDRVQAHILVCFLAFVLWNTAWRFGSLAPVSGVGHASSWKNS